MPASRWPWWWRPRLDAGAPCGRSRDDRDRSRACDPRHRSGARRRGLCAGATDIATRRSRRGAENGAAQAERRVHGRRAGAFLSRRPDRLRAAGRGRRYRRPFLDPASDGSPAHLRLGCSAATSIVSPRSSGGWAAGSAARRANASWVAGAAALAANHTGRPVKLRLPREADMLATGKRHPFLYRYTVGFDGEGRVLALDAMLAADAGWRGLDLTPGVGGRARSPPHRQRLLDLRISAPSATPARRTSSRTPRFAASAARRACRRGGCSIGSLASRP